MSAIIITDNLAHRVFRDAPDAFLGFPEQHQRLSQRLRRVPYTDPDVTFRATIDYLRGACGSDTVDANAFPALAPRYGFPPKLRGVRWNSETCRVRSSGSTRGAYPCPPTKYIVNNGDT